MDLIYTNANREDVGVLLAYDLDLSFGADENDFELVLGINSFRRSSGGGGGTGDNVLTICGEVVCGEAYCGYTTQTAAQIDTSPETITTLEFGAVVYMEGTEYGGIVDGMETSTEGETIVYSGRTWHGCLNSKVIAPNQGASYFTVSGDANAVLAELVERLALSDLFTAAEESAGINISSYQFNRYCKGYDGIRAMLAANGAKLKISWADRTVRLSAVPIDDYTDYPVDGDIATLTVKRYAKTVNHLICLGSGELAEREVIHLYVDQNGSIGTEQYFTGLDEYTDVFDYGNAESSEDLLNNGTARLRELLNSDTADISIIESDGLVYDVGDIVGAKEYRSGVSVTAEVTQKIVKITNGVIRTEYKTGG